MPAAFPPSARWISATAKPPLPLVRRWRMYRGSRTTLFGVISPGSSYAPLFHCVPGPERLAGVGHKRWRRRLPASIGIIFSAYRSPLSEAGGPMSERRQDLFISHASGDKSRYIEPLANAFDRKRITYWMDSVEIRWGDSFPLLINEGLRKSRYVLV